jgi:hypothetical protein
MTLFTLLRVRVRSAGCAWAALARATAIMSGKNKKVVAPGIDADPGVV